MWELRDNNGPRVFQCVKVGAEKRCPICGQHFCSKEEYYIVVCNAIKEAREKGLSNIMPHKTCWDTFCAGISTDSALAAKLKSHKRPKCNPLTEEQNKAVNAFKAAAYHYGYYDINQTRKGCIKATKRGTTMSVIYDPYNCSVSYKDRRKQELFKSMFDRQIATNVYNKMQELLGTDLRDDYSVFGVMSTAIEETNKFFN